MINKKAALVMVPALALGMSVLGASAAQAHDDSAPAHAGSAQAHGGSSFQAQLRPLNDSGGVGMATVTLNGDMVTVNAKVGGLAMKFNGNAYPHVAHIHDMGAGECPVPSADKNDDGVVSTPEGVPAYGGIGATLTTKGDTSPKSALDLERAFGQGGHFTYHRTFKLDAATLAEVKKDNAVIVVHGLDPAKLSAKAQKEDSSPLTKDLPLAATAPALCGPLHPSQMTMPNGAAGTGGGTAQGPDAGLLAGGSMLLAAGAALVARRRVVLKRASN